MRSTLIIQQVSRCAGIKKEQLGEKAVIYNFFYLNVPLKDLQQGLLRIKQSKFPLQKYCLYKSACNTRNNDIVQHLAVWQDP